MPLYEIKLKCTPNESKELIQKLGLVFQKEFCDTDQYFKTAQDKPKTKLKIFNGKMRLDELLCEDNIFVIKGREVVEPEEQRAYKNITPIVQIEHRKEVYKWPAQHIETALDYIEGIAPTVFFEVFSHKRPAVLLAKNYLESIGYNKFFSQTYDELFLKNK